MKSLTFWITLGPLFVFNAYFLVTIALFPFFRRGAPKVDFIENRHHSRILNKRIRYWWIWMTTPLFRLFLKLRLTPNHISTAGTAMGLLSGLAFAFSDRWVGVNSYGVGGWMMVFGGTLDIMDGRLARETGQESLSGAFFDSVMDRVAECAVFAGLAWYFRGSWLLWLVMAAFTGAMLTSYAKCRGDKMGVSFEGGTMQRPERVVYTGVGALMTPMVGTALYARFPDRFPDIKAACDFLYALPLGFVAVMANVTTYQRIRAIMRLLDEKEE